MRKIPQPLHSPVKTQQVLKKLTDVSQNNNKNFIDVENNLRSNASIQECTKSTSFNEETFISEQNLSRYAIKELLWLRIPLLLNELTSVSYQQIYKHINQQHSQNNQNKLQIMKQNVTYTVKTLHTTSQEIINLITQLIPTLHPTHIKTYILWARSVIQSSDNKCRNKIISYLMDVYDNAKSDEEKYQLCQVIRLFLGYPNRAIQYFLLKCGIDDINKLCTNIYEFIHSNVKYGELMLNQYDIIAAKIANISKLQQCVYNFIDSNLQISLSEQASLQFVALNKCTVIPFTPEKPLYAIQNIDTGHISAHSYNNSSKFITHSQQRCNLIWFQVDDGLHKFDENKINFSLNNICYYGIEQSKIYLHDYQSLQSLTLKNCQAIDLSNCINLQNLSLQLVNNVNIQQIQMLSNLQNIYVNTIYVNQTKIYEDVIQSQDVSNLQDKIVKYGVKNNILNQSGIQLLDSLSKLPNLEVVTIINQEMCKIINLNVCWSKIKALQLKLCSNLEQLSIHFILPQLPSNLFKCIQEMNLQLNDNKIYKLHLQNHCRFPDIEFLDVGDDVALYLDAVKINLYFQQHNYSKKHHQTIQQPTKCDQESTITLNSDQILNEEYSDSSSRFKDINNIHVYMDKSAIMNNEINDLLDDLKSESSEAVSMSLPQSSCSDTRVANEKNVEQTQIEKNIVTQKQNQQNGKIVWENIASQRKLETYDITDQNIKLYMGQKQYSDIFSNISFLRCKNSQEITVHSDMNNLLNKQQINRKHNVVNGNTQQS